MEALLERIIGPRFHESLVEDIKRDVEQIKPFISINTEGEIVFVNWQGMRKEFGVEKIIENFDEDLLYILIKGNVLNPKEKGNYSIWCSERRGAPVHNPWNSRPPAMLYFTKKHFAQSYFTTCSDFEKYDKTKFKRNE